MTSRLLNAPGVAAHVYNQWTSWFFWTDGEIGLGKLPNPTDESAAPLDLTEPKRIGDVFWEPMTLTRFVFFANTYPAPRR